MTDPPTITVLIITYRRAHYLDECLRHLERQSVLPSQVIVVDGSPDDESEHVAAQHPIATYVRNPAGAGNMTSSRNAGLAYVSSDIIAFLDDDANAAPEYCATIAEFCAENPSVSIGCGRALNAVTGEEVRGLDKIGLITRRGQIFGNFAADPGADIPIDHGLGATMWIRTSLMRRLGGFREYFPGTSACEDTDLFLRAKRLGEQPWLVRGAIAHHVAAPQEGGQRFDRRYTYWGAHNRSILFMADLGLARPTFMRFLIFDLVHNLSYGGAPHRRVARTGIVFAAWMMGVGYGLRLFGAGPVPPVGGYVRSGHADPGGRRRSRLHHGS